MEAGEERNRDFMRAFKDLVVDPLTLRIIGMEEARLARLERGYMLRLWIHGRGWYDS